MKKIILVIILGTILYIPFTSLANAAFSCASSTEGFSDCQRVLEEIKKIQEKTAEENRLIQEKVTAQKETDDKIQKQIIEQKKAEELRQENEAKLKIKDLEGRINQLENKAPAIFNPKTSVITNEKTETVLNKKTETESVSAEQNPVIPTIETPQNKTKKISWFKRFLGWFKN